MVEAGEYSCVDAYELESYPSVGVKVDESEGYAIVELEEGFGVPFASVGLSSWPNALGEKVDGCLFDCWP